MLGVRLVWGGSDKGGGRTGFSRMKSSDIANNDGIANNDIVNG